MADRVGQQLGNYRLIRLLGHGGFAEVYLGEHIYLETPAAIKILYTQLASDDIEKFRLEARTVARLTHPHIVRVLEFGVQNSMPFLVMDYAPNGTLRQRHPRGMQLPLSIIVPYVKQVAEALQYAHDQKLVHRDIKPENMLVGGRNEILLSDFGIATVAHRTATQNVEAITGTSLYMAPELFQGKPRLASDQYSLGVVIYEWIAGEPPFPEGNFIQLGYQHTHVPPPPLREKIPSLSSEVEQVVMTSLAKDPHQRFMSVQAFANAFEQASQPSADKNMPQGRLAQPTELIPPPRQPQQATEFIASSEQPAVPSRLSTTSGQMPPTEPVTSGSQVSLPPTERAAPSRPSTMLPNTTRTPSPPQQQSSVVEPSKPLAAPTAGKVNLIPLGLIAFAVTTFVISAANAGLFSEAGIINSLILLYACGGLVQLIAGVHTLWTGKTLVGTALCSYGAFWLTIAGSLQFGWIPNATALGYFLLGWTIFTGLLFLSTLRHSRTFIAVFGALLLTFLSLTIAELGGGSTYGQIGGYLGMLTALIAAGTAWYTATHRPELPAAPAINPIPLGLSAFALTTFVVSALNAGLFFGAAIFIGLALFYGGLVEIIAGVQAFKTGHTFGAIAFCSNGGFWLILSFGIWQHLILSAAVVGYLMVGWIIFAIWAFVAALKTNIALIIVSVLTVLTLLALAVGNLGGGFTFTQIGGWLGLLLAVLAWYTALAFLLAEGRGSFVLPVGLIRRG